MTPLFSIVTVTANVGSTIDRTIASIDAQTCRDFEYIVIDGGSTDDTVERLKAAGTKVSLWISERDRGIYEAFNKGVRRARGTWVAFLGAGDTYLPDALEHYRAAIVGEAPRDTQYLSSRIQLLDGDRVVRTIGGAWSWPAFGRYMTVAHVGSMHHISLFNEYGYFDEDYRVCGDYELLLRPRDRLRSYFLDRVMATMPIGGISQHKLGLALSEQERAKRITGRRDPWRCALERRSAYVRATLRSLIWY